MARARRYCEQKVPAHARHQVRIEVEVEPRAVTIAERRAPWRADLRPEWSRSLIARLALRAADRRLDTPLARPQRSLAPL